MQLNKYIAHAGVCSRRKAVDLIKEGGVKVNGRVVKEPGYKVLDGDVVKVHNKVLVAEKKIYVLLNKPKGCVTTVADDKGRNTVMDLLGSSILQRLYPVGRLDVNTTGLLVLTNDGDLAQKLSHPKYEIDKVYQVEVSKPFTETDRALIQKGIRLYDGPVKVDSISKPAGAKLNQVRVSLHSGKYRIVRRLFEALGYFVNELDRVKYAGMSKRGLQVGQWRLLTQKEIEKLQK
jgi:pseudouridine synthase